MIYCFSTDLLPKNSFIQDRVFVFYKPKQKKNRQVLCEFIKKKIKTKPRYAEFECGTRSN